MHKIERDKDRRTYVVYRGDMYLGHAKTERQADAIVASDLMMMDQIARMRERYPLRMETE